MSAKVVVTGASGHIGFHVAAELCRRGFDTQLLIRRPNENIRLLQEVYGATADVVDFQDPASLKSHVANADVLFHLAAMNTTRQSESQSVLQSTAGLTDALFNLVHEVGLPQVVYTSSVVVLGRSRQPDQLITEHDRTETLESPYVRGKVAAEDLCDDWIERGLDLRRVYPSWVVGPQDSKGTPPQVLIRRFLKQGQRFSFSGGLSIAGVEEVARAHVNAWLSGQPGGKYLLGGDNLTFDTFYQLLAELAGKPAPLFRMPKWMMWSAAHALKLAGKVLNREAIIDPQYVESVVGRYSWYDSSTAVNELGYRIPSARESLQKAIRWERKKHFQVHTFSHHAKARTEPLKLAAEAQPPQLLITGVPGWLGNRFLQHFLEQHRDHPEAARSVRFLVEPRLADLLELPEPFEVVAADLRDADAVGRAVEGIKTVYHLAGAVYPRRVSTLYQVNVEGTRNLVDRCIEHNVRRFLFMSTDSVCGHGDKQNRVFTERTEPNPYRHYGKSKWLAEQYLMEKTHAGLIDGTVLRGFWFFGPYAPDRQREFFEMLGWRRQLVFGSGRNLRSVSHTENLLQAFLKAEPRHETVGRSYWICDAEPYTVDQIYQTLCQEVSVEYRPFYIPGVCCVACRWGDAMLQSIGIVHSKFQAIGKFHFDIAGSITAAEWDFDFKPRINMMEHPAEYLGEFQTPGIHPQSDSPQRKIA